MSGHSKWANIKHRKGRQDAKKSALFSHLSMQIAQASQKGADPETNTSLKLAISEARKAGLPKDNIERAIQKSASRKDKANMKEKILEAYGPGGVAYLIKVSTDNFNRAIAQVRSALNRFNAKLAQKGAAMYQFQEQGSEWRAKIPVEVSAEERFKNDQLKKTLQELEDVAAVFNNLA